jgi:hypothetical protein
VFFVMTQSDCRRCRTRGAGGCKANRRSKIWILNFCWNRFLFFFPFLSEKLVSLYLIKSNGMKWTPDKQAVISQPSCLSEIQSGSFHSQLLQLGRGIIAAFSGRLITSNHTAVVVVVTYKEDE